MMQATAVLPGQQRAEEKVAVGGQRPEWQPPAPLPATDSPATSGNLLSPASFSKYPVQARALAIEYLALLRTLPLPLLPLLLREIDNYDFRFPREREQIASQLQQLRAMPASQRDQLLASFRALQLPSSLAAMNWVAEPAAYLDALTAALWSTGQMPQFRRAARDYAEALSSSSPQTDATAALPRQVLIVLDRSLSGTPGLHKLRQHGVTMHIQDASGAAVLLQYAQQRAASAPIPYRHWYIDGGSTAVATSANSNLLQVSYDALAPLRGRLLQRASSVLSAERSGPEELRSLMAQTTPEQMGMAHADPVLSHFQLSLLTEGSGTQIFSTTFVQWAARECLRRAEPATLLLRWTPRQAQQSMNEMLSGTAGAGPDPVGSMVDAEQGALYTWINLQRLPDAHRACFLVWCERDGTAVAIGPGLPRGTTSPSTQTMAQALRLFS